MTFRDIWSAFFRRPWLVLLVAGLCGVWGVQEIKAPVVYESRVVLTLLAPTTPFPSNSYASFPSGLVLIADVSAKAAQAPGFAERVRREGGAAEFQVVLANRGNQELPIHDQPYLWVSTRSTDPVQSRRTMQATLRVLRMELRERQRAEGAVTGSYVTWRMTSSSGGPVPLVGRPSRQLVGLALMTLLATGYLALLAERHGWRLPLPRRGGGDRRPPRGPASRPPAPHEALGRRSSRRPRESAGRLPASG